MHEPQLALPSTTIVAVTRRIVLRRFIPQDLPALISLDADPAVTRFITGGAPVDPAVVQSDLLAWLHEYEHGDDEGCWAADLRRDGTFLGWFHLRTSLDDVRPTLGYRLRRDVWGRGLATEASLALLERAFDTTAVPGIRAETLAVHASSRRVMEKIGMTLVRTFVSDWPVSLPGDEEGDVEYEITRTAWLARSGRRAGHVRLPAGR